MDLDDVMVTKSWCTTAILNLAAAILVWDCAALCGACASMGEEPISVQIRAVANLCKYECKNIFFRDRQ